MTVIALNSIFQHWGLSAPQNSWNTSGDPCSGTAIDSTKVDSSNINPAIKCDCSFDNGTTCHLRELYVHPFIPLLHPIEECMVTLFFLVNRHGLNLQIYDFDEELSDLATSSIPRTYRHMPGKLSERGRGCFFCFWLYTALASFFFQQSQETIKKK